MANSMLLNLRRRGRDASGYLAPSDDGHVQIEKRIGGSERLVKARDSIRPDVRTLLLHTRWATVGDSRDIRNAHPVAFGKCAAIHNGTIYNDRELFRSLGLAAQRTTGVDSEIIPAIVDAFGWNEALSTLNLFEGGAAVAIVNQDHPGELVLARTSGYPLVYGKVRDALIFASEAWHIEYALRTRNQTRFGKLVTMSEYHAVRFDAHGREAETLALEPPKYVARPSNVTSIDTARSKRKIANRSSIVVPHGGLVRPSRQLAFDEDSELCTCDDWGSDDDAPCPEHEYLLGEPNYPRLERSWQRSVYGDHVDAEL